MPGYYTNYTLYIDGPAELVEGFIAAYRPEEDSSNIKISDYVFYKDYSGYSQYCKWYDHLEVMQSISRDWSELFFTLNGWRDETLNIWVKYFYAGKAEHFRAEVTYPPTTLR
jgi:hypothetical protein